MKGLGEKYIEVTVTKPNGTFPVSIAKRSVTYFGQHTDDGRLLIKADGGGFLVDQSYETVKKMMGLETDDWHICEKDGNPKSSGAYKTIVIYQEANAAFFGSRYFMSKTNDGESGWNAVDGETVYAWKPYERGDFPDLPDGIKPAYLIIKEMMK